MYASGRFFYKPITLTALGVGMAVLAYVAMTQDVLKEGEEKKRMYVLSLRPTRPMLIQDGRVAVSTPPSPRSSYSP